MPLKSIRLIPEFRKILERDRGSKGDQQGRLKIQATKEFHYIYGIADFLFFILARFGKRYISNDYRK